MNLIRPILLPRLQTSKKSPTNFDKPKQICFWLVKVMIIDFFVFWNMKTLQEIKNILSSHKKKIV